MVKLIVQHDPKLNSSVRKHNDDDYHLCCIFVILICLDVDDFVTFQQWLSLSFVLSSDRQFFLSLKLAVARDNIPYLVVMDQNLKDDDFSVSGFNEDIPERNTNNEGEKSNKCNQCEYASSVKSSLRRQLWKDFQAEKRQLDWKITLLRTIFCVLFRIRLF